MQTVILPGGSSKNKVWLDECAKEIQVDGIVRPITWDHWLDPAEKFDPKEKATLISHHSRGDKLNIIAKSIGSLVAAYIIEAIPTQIEKVIICGIPIHDISDDEKETIKKVLSGLNPKNLLCIQNEADPHGTYSEVKNFLPNINIISKPRSDHDYPYYEDFNSFLKYQPNASF